MCVNVCLLLCITAVQVLFISGAIAQIASAHVNVVSDSRVTLGQWSASLCRHGM